MKYAVAGVGLTGIVYFVYRDAALYAAPIVFLALLILQIWNEKHL